MRADAKAFVAANPGLVTPTMTAEKLEAERFEHLYETAYKDALTKNPKLASKVMERWDSRAWAGPSSCTSRANMRSLIFTRSAHSRQGLRAATMPQVRRGRWRTIHPCHPGSQRLSLLAA
jgi:hypothetical protein